MVAFTSRRQHLCAPPKLLPLSFRFDTEDMQVVGAACAIGWLVAIVVATTPNVFAVDPRYRRKEAQK